MSRGLGLVCIFALAFTAWAEAVLPLSQLKNQGTINNHLYYLKDSQRQLQLEQILDKVNESSWHKSPTSVVNMGYSKAHYWVRLDVVNDGINTSDLVLEIGYPMLNTVEFYLLVDNQVDKKVITGNRYPFAQRDIAHRNFAFSLNLLANQRARVYLKVASESAIQLPLKLLSRDEFYADDQWDVAGKFGYYGIMLAMLLYNFFLLISLREKVYLYYVGFVFGLTGFMFCYHGFAAQYVWPQQPALAIFGVQSLLPVCVFFASLFAREFLQLSKNAPIANRAFQWVAALSAMNVAGIALLDYASSINLTFVCVSFGAIVSIIVGPYLWRKGIRYARLYTLAWLFMTTMGIAWVFNKIGLVPANYLIENGVALGAIAEALFLSLALADRLNYERNERYLAEVKLNYNATHHPVTSYPNRAFLSNWINQSRQHSQSWQLVLINLQRFSEVTKTLGHEKSDVLLRIISHNCNELLKNNSAAVCLDKQHQHYLSTLDDEHFAVIINKTDARQGPALVNALIAKLIEVVEFDGMPISTGGVVGIAPFAALDSGATSLLRQAQIALDHGLGSGDNITQYAPYLNPYSQRRLALAGELRHAISDGHLNLYFQPKVVMRTGQVNSMEALLRWQHPQHGFIAPDELVTIAEQLGFIDALTAWVINHAIDSVGKLQQQGHDLVVAVNISALNLKDKDFPQQVQQALTKHNVSSQHLALEVTESAMMDDPKSALVILKQLNQLGIRLAIDDYGTGYSSLAYIKQLPVQEIKIDRSFIEEVNHSKSDAIIVRTTVNMCHDLGLEVVAEGVETAAAMQVLQDMGCDYLQGYYYSKPLPLSEFCSWLAKRKNSQPDALPTAAS